MSEPSVIRRSHEEPIAPDVRALQRRIRAGEAAFADVAERDRPLTQDPRAQRRELYILLAVCLDRVIDDFISGSPTEALSRLPEYPGPVSEWASAALCERLLDTFVAFVAEQSEAWRSADQPGGIAPLLRRIDACGPGVSAVLDRPRIRYAEHLMQAGMTTMAAVAPPVMAAAVRAVSRDEADPVHSAVDLAHRSVRIISQMAALGLDEVGRLQRELIDQDTMEFRDPGVVRLVAATGGSRLELTHDLASQSPPGLWPTPPSYAHRIGCPTLVRTGPTSPLERLWAWTVDAAQATGYFAVRV